ncbi:MAG TPA: septation protein SepH [Pseudonocardiaceae bacterium]|nr:septation protein SepH [Pseudonocardiaceae bacterium]
MRALRVVGLWADDRTIVVEAVSGQPSTRREQFTLAVDETLRAALRGDLPRLNQTESGQTEIEPENQMRPREIQARIRAGASVEQVASAAGAPSERIERFAYPVLLERSRMAQLAQQAHPVRADGPDVRTLDVVVAETFEQRGHDPETMSWDSWRGENCKWVLELCWRTGRSENRAHWTFHPGAHGGTVTALDDQAGELIDPRPAAPLRTVPPASEDHPQTTPPTPAKRPRKTRAPMPSWEDVLLGVRSPR